jgi:hypothetical protein
MAEFFSKPDNLSEIFGTAGEAFTTAQNDECESIIINLLKSRPSLVVGG